MNHLNRYSFFNTSKYVPEFIINSELPAEETFPVFWNPAILRRVPSLNRGSVSPRNSFDFFNTISTVESIYKILTFYNTYYLYVKGVLFFAELLPGTGRMTWVFKPLFLHVFNKETQSWELHVSLKFKTQFRTLYAGFKPFIINYGDLGGKVVFVEDLLTEEYFINSSFQEFKTLKERKNFIEELLQHWENTKLLAPEGAGF